MQRLGKNLGGYLGETINLIKVLRGIERVAVAHGWESEDFLQLGSFRLFGLHRPPVQKETPPRRIYISTGIHGDEPAGPLAAAKLLEENRWPADAEIWFCPCLNPTGLVRNRRENDKGIDLNRDYLHLQSDEVRAHVQWLQRLPQFDLCLCLHEDWEAYGFYVYELNLDNVPSLAEPILRAVEKVCPIDPSEVIEGRSAFQGIIRPSADPLSRAQWPEAFFLTNHKSRLSYTLEAPSDFSLSTRVDALVAGVNAAVEQFEK